MLHQKDFARILLASTLFFSACGANGDDHAGGIPQLPLDDTVVSSEETHRFSSYADIVEPATEAVVSVTTASIVQTMQGRGRSPVEEFLRRFYGVPDSGNGGGNNGGGTERRIPNGLGSGVIISEDGYIITNNHVVTDDRGEPADEITIHLGDGEELEAKLVGRDPRTDIALLKIDQEGLPFIPMANSDRLRVGDIVFAIGNPLGVGQTSTMGIVSATRRTNLGLLGNQGYENFIQTDAAINRGNSGGALIDARGRLVGINTAIYSQNGGSIGIGFAVPSKLARTVVLELVDNGEVRRGYIGVSIRDLSPELAEAFGLDSADGALIEMVQEGHPAAIAGLQRGDVILQVDGRTVESVADLRLTVAAIRPGTTVDIVASRNGERMTFQITLTSLENPMASVDSGISPLEGVMMAPVTPDAKDEWNLPGDIDEGLVISEVEVRSAYSESLAPGMVILEVNDEPTRSLEELRNALNEGAVNKLWVWYRGNNGFVALRLP